MGPIKKPLIDAKIKKKCFVSEISIKVEENINPNNEKIIIFFEEYLSFK